MSEPEEISGWINLVRRTAVEIAIAQPGSDNGLLPLNSALMEMEERLAAMALPPALAAAILAARRILDQTFETTARFDEANIEWFSQWQEWLQDAVECWHAGRQLENFPSGLRPEMMRAPTMACDSPAQAPIDDAPLNIALDSDRELLREFIAESYEHLETIECSILVLEQDPDAPDTLDAIFRGFHTFKGGSGLLKLTPIQNLAHDLESLLDALRERELPVGSSVISLILEGSDALKQFIVAVENQLIGKEPRTPIHVATARLRARIQEVLATRCEAKAAGNPNKCEVPLNSSAPSTPLRRSAATYVKVDTQKLDTLIEMIGEQVIAQSMVVQDPAVLTAQTQQLSRNLAQLRRVTNELQRTAMALRMVPIRGTFQKMARLVRDVAAKQQKQVRLLLEGEETELDRNVVEVLGDALVHMVRNAIDHGIEPPHTRIATGKQSDGTVKLTACHRGGNVVVEMQDDGAGLNTARIREKAVERGIIDANLALSDKEVCRLIFKPGFSTAPEVTELSGRGVGLDVVQRSVETLRGKVDVESVPGCGTRFILQLPLTLAIIDGLIVSAGPERYVLPTLSVKESFRPTPGMISTVNGRGEVANVRGRLTPVLRLADHFGVKARSSNPCESIGVVVESGDALRCLLVDELIGKQEVVIKNLASTWRRHQALAGAAILGDGRVGLILDVDSLVHMASPRAASCNQQTKEKNV